MSGIRFHQVPRQSKAKPIRPGFSLRKLGYDLQLFFAACRQVHRERYDYIHGVEEAAFLAWIIHRWTGIPFVCDMDSSIPDQLAEGNPLWRPVRPIMRWIESAMLRRSRAVLAVCDALADRARRCTRAPIFVLRDPPLGGAGPAASSAPVAIPPDRTAFVYVGNLQKYQGIPLLLKAFQRAAAHAVQACLIIVGGEALDVEMLERRCSRMGIADRVSFLGARTVEESEAYLQAADVLVSPRISGVNTPMKIYSYMQAGKAILATDIPAHSQVLTPDSARIVAPEPDALAEAIVQLAQDEELRHRLGHAAREVSQQRYSREVFDQTADQFCAWMESAAAPKLS